MFDMILGVLKGIWVLIKYPLYFICVCIGIFVFLVFINIIIELIKGRRFKTGEHNRVKKHNFFRKIFIDMPHQFVIDLFNREPDFFKYQGLIIFEGRQGAGKTVSMIEFAMRMQEEYPLAKLTSNLAYKYEDNKLKDWRMLINYKNGKKGVIVVMDELQNWFSSNDSKNFPPEMLGVITQNRKNRRIILGTSQNFYLLAKAIRSQATEVRRCTTLLGCLTIVRRAEPILDSEGNVAEWKSRGMYFFVHNKKLRESYDTYKVIENLSKSGFKEPIPDTNITIIESNKKK